MRNGVQRMGGGPGSVAKAHRSQSVDAQRIVIGRVRGWGVAVVPGRTLPEGGGGVGGRLDDFCCSLVQALELAGEVLVLAV